MWEEQQQSWQDGLATSRCTGMSSHLVNETRERDRERESEREGPQELRDWCHRLNPPQEELSSCPGPHYGLPRIDGGVRTPAAACNSSLFYVSERQILKPFHA